MATYRRPKGSYQRNTPDWFTDALAYSSGQVNGGGGGAGLSVSLFNNHPQSYHFHLYGLWVNDSNNEQLFAAVLPGTYGTQYDVAYPVTTDQAQPPGQIFTGATPAGLTLVNQPLTWQGNQPTPPILAPWPIAVIPVNYSFVVYNGFSSAAIIASFWWVALQA